jgi:cytoskeletal protein RodZ
MSQQHPQQPGSDTPPPKKTPVGVIVGLGCLGIVVFFALLGIVGSIIGDDSTSKGTSVSAGEDKGTESEKKDDAPAADPKPSKAAKEDAENTKPEEPTKTEKPAASATADRDQETDAGKAAGIPPKPTGEERQALLNALAAAAPDVVRYEDKAIDAARNQCSAINGGAQRLNWSASQRFTYKDVVTSEAQGAKINKALEDSGFCTA